MNVRTLLRAQVVTALWLPWALVVAGPGVAVPVGALILAASIAFAVINRHIRAWWLIPLSAAASLALPLVPYGTPRTAATWAAAAVALSVTIVAWPARADAPTRSRRPRARFAAVAGLASLSLVLGTTAAWSVVQEDREYADAQAAAATSWGAAPGLRARPTPPGAVARLEFTRDGTDHPIAGGIYVFRGIDGVALAKGPGWYPDTARPGSSGNTAIAGHRSGFGSPFADLDEVRTRDQITVVTETGKTLSYHVIDTRLVDPEDIWVLGDDPLNTGQSTLTLTTCDPPNINSKRLVVFAAQDAST
jgi:sortase A